MLMDEPFGAIDPITREHLQNEFLRLQKRIKKTILFVTHDIDEAIKMGTRVCILQVGGRVEQYGPPDEILSHPANDFVADFVGADRGLKRLGLVRAGDAINNDVVRAYPRNTTNELVGLLEEAGQRTAWIVDEGDRLVGYVMLNEARGHDNVRADQLMKRFPATTEPEATLKDAYSEMLTHGLITLPVLDREGELKGVIFADDVQALIRSEQEKE
jgi:osmoprotectant transport system ATP-binding protein